MLVENKCGLTGAKRQSEQWWFPQWEQQDGVSEGLAREPGRLGNCFPWPCLSRYLSGTRATISEIPEVEIMLLGLYLLYIYLLALHVL